MKLATHDNSGLMEVTKITADGSRLVITGTILGTLPIRTVLTAGEARKALSLLNFKTIIAALRMLVFG